VRALEAEVAEFRQQRAGREQSVLDRAGQVIVGEQRVAALFAQSVQLGPSRRRQRPDCEIDQRGAALPVGEGRLHVAAPHAARGEPPALQQALAQGDVRRKLRQADAHHVFQPGAAPERDAGLFPCRLRPRLPRVTDLLRVLKQIQLHAPHDTTAAPARKGKKA